MEPIKFLHKQPYYLKGAKAVLVPVLPVSNPDPDPRREHDKTSMNIIEYRNNSAPPSYCCRNTSPFRIVGGGTALVETTRDAYSNICLYYNTTSWNTSPLANSRAVTAQVGASGKNGAPQVGTLANAGSLLLGTQSIGTALQSLTSP